MQESLLIQKTVLFARPIIPIHEALRKANHHYLADQMFKSAMSIGANIHEAQAAESRHDFIHKFKIANKEIWETGYWFKVCDAIIPISPEIENQRLIIHKIINKSIQTALINLTKEKRKNKK